MKKSYLRARTIYCIVLLAVLLTACIAKKQSPNDSVVKDPPEEVELPDIKLSGVTLDKKDVIATIEIEKEIKGIDALGVGGAMGVTDGYVEGTIDIGWFGEWENDEQPPQRLVVGVGTGAASITDVIGGGSGECNESQCCRYTYSWAIQYLYIGYFTADPTCRLYGSITVEEWIDPVLVDSYGACAVMLPPELYSQLYKGRIMTMSFYESGVKTLGDSGPMVVTTTSYELKNFPWADGLCKGN